MAVDPRVNLQVNPAVQMGRQLDANPMLGARGVNSARPVSPLLQGNLYAQGVVGYGLSLRSPSPISDPLAFRASLGSAALSAFRRDSVSVGSNPLGLGGMNLPYYDISTTVPTVGFLQGFAGPTAPTGLASGAPNQRLQTRLDLRISPQTEERPAAMPGLGQQWTGPGGTPTSMVPPWAAASDLKKLLPELLATSSSLFGTESPLQSLGAVDQPPWWSRLREPPKDATLTRPLNPRLDIRQDFRLLKPEEVLATPLNQVLRPELYAPVGVGGPGGEVLTYTGKLGLVLPPREEGPPGPMLPRPSLVDASVLPGFDVLTDMKLALALEAEPNAPWFNELRQAVREHPELLQQAEEIARLNAQEFVARVLQTPLRSMTGQGPSAVNDQMLKAESLMDIGHYAEAADRYEAARVLDPTNPLPLLGKGLALLAQGNYQSAAQTLIQGIALADRTPGLAGVLLRRLDLMALMGGGEIIDIRRADLMQQLELREVPELRFLLGFLEYHSGDRQRGLENLKRAADNPHADALIGRYPTLLEGQTAPLRPEPQLPALPGEPTPSMEPLKVPPPSEQ